MQCPVTDKETINGAALAKGIKSTHARPLFKLIKGFFLGGQLSQCNKDKQRKKQETALAILAAFILSQQIFSVR